MKSIATFLSATVLAMSLASGAFAAGGDDGAISIPLKEYERLKDLEEGDKKKQYWKMSFEQILQKENNNYRSAWEKYEFWVLRRIHLDTSVNPSSVTSVITEIETLNKVNNTAITLIISSPGGSVLDGLRLVNVMNKSLAPVNTVCDDFAVSMGAVIFANGRQRVADQGCIFMIHELSVGSPGGQTTEHVKWTETVIDIETMLVDNLSVNSGLSTKDVRKLMEYETFWSAEEVYRLGFADVYYQTTRSVPPRTIPNDLLPINRMKDNFNEKLDK